MGQLSNPPAPNGAAWHEYATVVAVRTNPTLYGQVELVVEDAQGERATVRVRGAVIRSN